ncbi:MAG: electron transfer flavoprotein subunit alpha/FixB family protein [Thermodesulfobacteriota bacterium]
MKNNILLVAETIDNQVAPVSAELSGLAARLSAITGGRANFLIAGSDIVGPAGEFAAKTGRPALVIQHPSLCYPNPELLADVVSDLAARQSFHYICFPHTATGCQAAARAAVKTNAVCVSGISDLRADEDDIIFQRSLFNGKLAMDIRATDGPVVLTALPGAFSKSPDDPGLTADPEIIVRSVENTAVAYQPLTITAADDTDAGIDRADIIIAAGRGIGDRENLELVHRLARLFPNAAVAASRPLCDLKWLPYSRQVGATGKTVAPKLYLACGISGAQQHVYGMKDSQWIAAINTDPNAAIFSVADYCVVEDVTTFLPVLADMYENR